MPRLKQIYLTDKNGKRVPIRKQTAERIAANSLHHVVRRDKDGEIIEVRALGVRPRLFGESQKSTYIQTLENAKTIALKDRDGVPVDKAIARAWKNARWGRSFKAAPRPYRLAELAPVQA